MEQSRLPAPNVTTDEPTQAGCLIGVVITDNRAVVLINQLCSLPCFYLNVPNSTKACTKKTYRCKICFKLQNEGITPEVIPVLHAIVIEIKNGVAVVHGS